MMDGKIMISWAPGDPISKGPVAVDVTGKGLEVLFALARATSGILSSMARVGESDGLLVEYIGMLVHVAHDDGEQLARLDLSGKGVRQ